MTQVESRAAPLLASVSGPEELRRLPRHLLPGLAQELRTELVRSVLRTGGHLGPNLGVVELTIALHRVFESPRDVLLWDVGHQAYVHKMLTGRLASFGSLRREGGLSGYPCRAESEHDVVENSHASTALSYADGLAKAFALTGRRDRRVVAVVGDGALTGGLCWEALNNLGAAPDRPVVVVLNDNGRSYDETAGRLPQHLRELREGSAHGNLFESLGLCYLGPVDGHDVDAVERALRAAAALQQPVVVHVVTRKGRGHVAAELDEADRMHTVAPHGSVYDVPSRSIPPWTEVFGDELALLGDTYPELVAITAAMLRPTGLLAFSRRHPDRTFDVGIAEQHAVASAAGLAAAGLHPVVAIYSTFLNRAFDQVLMDVALHRSPVTFVLDRAGITGPDGPSHHGMWDLGLLGLVPGLRLAAPRDARQLRALLGECVRHDGPTAIRFPRGTPPAPMAAASRWGTAHVLVRGDGDVLVVALGPLAAPAVDAARALHREGIRATVVDPRWVSPLDPALVERAGRHRLVVTVEDNAPAGGLGDMLARALGPGSPAPGHLALALPDSAFVRAGDRSGLLRAHGLDAEGICRAVRKHVCAR
ncbi:MAG TPA: 1-deoxy-D-xylulose-5-phosphate synthase [Nocardioides sp.]|uniref:1-deoxy-D-xylulose-5-phosphate synthase n=1 Tax=Nocardioides sp. TaxID=35761 RepID=UPI002E352C03|nr:1-deoxy-D-xylulose-5-phosphate synthase [Nocardioides sp.]HEX5087640.1 1-deoxy-D-xylulose-5-phosphate synthase [Nocardioides sp.]